MFLTFSPSALKEANNKMCRFSRFSAEFFPRLSPLSFCFLSTVLLLLLLLQQDRTSQKRRTTTTTTTKTKMII